MGELEARVRLLEAALDALSVGVSVKNLEGRYVYVNRAAAAMLGRESVIGRSDEDLLPAPSAAAIGQADDKVRETGIPQTFDELVERRGRRRVFRVVRSPCALDGGVGIITARSDVSEERQIQRDLVASRARFQHLAETIPEVFWISTASFATRIVFATPAFEEIWGRPIDALYADERLLLDTVHPDDRERVDEAYAGSAAGMDLEYRILRPDGQVRWVRTRAFPSRRSGTNRVRLAGISEDITARKDVETQLHRAAKMEAVGRLAGGVAHDFNNMLSVITTYSELALAELDPDGELYADLDQIKRAAQKSAGLVRKLLAFSKKDTAAQEILNLGDSVVDMERMLTRVIGADVELVTEIDPEAGLVRADPTHVEQIIMNLVVNARQSMESGGRIRVGVANANLAPRLAANASDTWVALRVADTGCGMDPETLERIFEPFFTTKQDSGGTGLGLATVYALVQQNMGHIEVESERGRGTTFTIYFPWRAEESSTMDLPIASDGPSGGNETVLLVEDDVQLRSLTRRVLERSGYTVLEAETAGDALLICEKHPEIDMLLTDVVMPRMHGLELADRVTELRGRTRTLFVSGYPGDEETHARLLAPGVHFLPKPFTPTSLLEAVRRALAA